MENKLPEGWEWKKLGEITTNYDGKRVPLKKEERKDVQGIYPYYGASGIIDYVNDYLFDGEYLLVGEDGANLIAKSTPIAFKAPGKFWANNHAHILKTSEDVSLSYLMYYINNIDLKKYVTGTAQPKLTQQSMNRIVVPVPPLETQQKIVSVLEKAEETKKLRAQADELTQKLLQSVFLEMFGDPITNLKNWKEIKLKDVSEIVSGATKGRKLSGKSTVFVPYLRVANVQDGYLNLTEIKDIEVLPSDVEKYALQDGDILLTEGGDPDKLGRGTVWNRQIPTCIHQNHIFRVRVDRECLIPEYLSMLIGSAYGKMYFLKSAKQTTGIASINSTQLKNFPALIAPLDLQLKFAEMVHQIEKTTESQKQSSLEINNLFDALMQKTLTGELAS